MKRKIMEKSIRAILNTLLITKGYEIFRSRYGGIGHILMLHRVISPGQQQNGCRCIPTDIELTTDELEELISYFQKKNYAFVSMDDVHKILQGKNIGKKFVAFTFDDGYVDLYTHAFPILYKHGVPFSINLCTGFPDRNVIIWWYLLEDLLADLTYLEFEMDETQFSYQLTTSEEKYFAFRNIRDYLLKSGEPDFLAKMEKIFGPMKIDLFGKTEELGLSWEQIREMSKCPLVTFGAHTSGHKPFTKLTEAEIKQEIRNSVELIENQIGQKVQHFSYPFGKNESGLREFAIVKEFGFKTAVTTRFTNVFPEHRGHMECLPRIYKIGEIPLLKYLDVLTSGGLSALVYRFKRIV